MKNIIFVLVSVFMTASYANAGFGKPAKGKPAKKMQPMASMEKGSSFRQKPKKKKPTVYGMTSEDIKKKFKKNYRGA